MINFWNRMPTGDADVDCAGNKQWLFETYYCYFYARLAQMFKYLGLPDTIPSEVLSYYLLSNGWTFFTRVEGNYYIFNGGLGGEPDVYYRPTVCVVSNPALNISKDFKLDEDGILIRNDKFRIGLDYLIRRYSALMAENLLTMRTADIILRLIALLSAPDDSTKASAEAYLKKLYNGELGVVSENKFFDGIKLQSPPSSNGSYVTQFIELHQYYKGSFYNEIGLNANFNMKRESIGKGEASLSQDSILPLCDSMLTAQQEDFEKINRKYGLELKVEFDSAWRQNQLEEIYELRQLKNEADSSQLGEGGNNEINDSGNSAEDISVDREGEQAESGDSFGDGQREEKEVDEDAVGDEIVQEEVSENGAEDEDGDDAYSEESNDSADVQVNIEIINQTGGEDVKEDEDDYGE